MLGELHRDTSFRTMDLPWFVLPALILVAGAPMQPANADQGSGDFGNDCAVTLNDFASFEACLGGPGSGLAESECW